MKDLKTSLKNVFSEKKKKKEKKRKEKKMRRFFFFFFPDYKRPNDLQGFNFANLPKICEIRKD